MTIQTPLGIEACKGLLRETTAPDSLRNIFVSSGTILCSITGDSFRLRQKKSYNNSFEPLFYGKLTANTGGTVVSGTFRMRPFVIVFMAVWFGFLAVFLVGAVVRAVHGFVASPGGAAGGAFMMLLAPLVMAAFGAGMVAVGWWLGKSQKAEMTRFLETTFSAEATAAGPRTTPRTEQPIMMALPIFVLLGLGLMSVVFAIAGISSFHAGAATGRGSDMTVTYAHGFPARSFAFGQGLFLLFLAYGIWKRLYVAWTLGFVAIALSGVSFLFNAAGMRATPGAPPPPWPVDVFIGLGGLAVGAYWAAWWYRKKDYFTE